MSEELLTPLAIPPRRDGYADVHRAGPQGPLPIVDVETGPVHVPMAYAIGRIDASGRVHEQSIITALGWETGQTLTITASDGAVIIRRDPRGVFTLHTTSHLTIPGPLRTRYHIQHGHRVLLTATRAHDTILIYTMALLHHTLSPRHLRLLNGDAP